MPCLVLFLIAVNLDIQRLVDATVIVVIVSHGVFKSSGGMMSNLVDGFIMGRPWSKCAFLVTGKN